MAEVLVFVMDGCGACAELKPLAERTAAHYSRCVATRIIDVNDDSDFADAMGIEETPTVIGVDGNRRPIARMVGHDGTPDRLLKVYAKVLGTVTSCQIEPFGDV